MKAKKFKIHVLLLALLCSVLLTHGTLLADDHELARQALEQGQILPLREVLGRVEQQYAGQVVKIEFEREDGRFIYEIRLLQTDGRVAKLEVDATNGEVLKIKRKKMKRKRRR